MILLDTLVFRCQKTKDRRRRDNSTESTRSWKCCKTGSRVPLTTSREIIRPKPLAPLLVLVVQKTRALLVLDRVEDANIGSHVVLRTAKDGYERSGRRGTKAGNRVSRDGDWLGPNESAKCRGRWRRRQQSQQSQKRPRR